MFWRQLGKRDEVVEFLSWDQQVAFESEPGTLRFDFYDDPENENALYLYESYTDEAAFDVHKSHEPFKKFGHEIVPNCIDSFDRILTNAVELGSAKP
ncbi:MAG: antibiotic biosynthesis monooxygenase [Chloroflexi bacterium]|nr:antibiotic biosynthesis monooxygenase [Chloroflexota bacterium]